MNKKLHDRDENEQNDHDLDNNDKVEELEDIENSNQSWNKKKFHYIITETDDTAPLPKLIEISDPYPGEPRWMRKRKGPAVI